MNNYHKEKQERDTLLLRSLMQQLPSFVGEYLRGTELKNQSGTRLEYARDIMTFLTFLKEKNPSLKEIEIKDFELSILDSIEAIDIDEYMEYLTVYTLDGKSFHNGVNTKARKLSSLSSLYLFFIKRKQLKNNPISATERPAIKTKNIVVLNNDEITSLIQDIRSGKGLSKRELTYHERTKYRDIAIATVFLLNGPRVSELVALDLDDVNFSTGTLRVIRKGGNEDILYFGNEVHEALEDYLETRASLLPYPDDSEPALFLSLRGRRITQRSIEIMIKKYIDRNTSIHKRITPHKLRATYGTKLYEATGDIYLVASVLGHKDVNTTQKHYAALHDERKIETRNTLSLKNERPSHGD